MQALWSNKQRQGNPLHRICAYQGSFPPQLPAFFLDRYPEARVVLDPFCGRGTVVLEAALRRKTVYGVDLLPVARCLSQVKLRCPPRWKVLAEIEALDLSGPAPEPPPNVEPFYHPETFRQLWHLRERPRSEALTAVALGRMHGHSPGFFSATTFNVISIPPASMEKLKVKHKTVAEPRDVRSILAKAASRFIPEDGIDAKGAVFCCDAESIPLPDSSVDLVITSPPFLDVIDYADVNWLRGWLLGQGFGQPPGELAMTSDVEAYVRFLRRSLSELCRVLARMGRIVFEVGPVKKERNMAELVARAVDIDKRLVVEDVIEHNFAAEDGERSVPKISRAMRGGGKGHGKQTTTMGNHCVVLRRAGT